MNGKIKKKTHIGMQEEETSRICSLGKTLVGITSEETDRDKNRTVESVVPRCVLPKLG